MSYARGTNVSAERSKAEIEALLRRYGADAFASAWDSEKDQEAIQFRSHGRFVRFLLPIPAEDDPSFIPTRNSYRASKAARAAENRDDEIRRRWRALVLVVKAKLECVESGITTFETEFMAHIVMPDGRTVSEHVAPQIDAAYKGGKVRGTLLLGDGK